ncbi:DoxX family protein [Mucilaginibacter arboris]|uniref:DoxX family protein n=1 Tax=Mucilaginibacter arboris TaxID=2682090 RepID=A0A7K1STW0_9SPHI|nr:DoxX family protein [Mucilaginibacter arboris]MVN20756.1 DoxX family protein [Mucilaginibacter arboris]
MKSNKIIYWISTGLFCAFLLLTSISYLTDPKFVDIFKHLGFPQYFRVELAVAKILGVLILLLPKIKPKYKEWAYAGFGITLISGLIAHFNSSDSVGYIINVLFWFALLVISYSYWHKRTNERINSSIT